MSEIVEAISRINEKAKRVIESNNQLRYENDALRKNIEELKAQTANTEVKIAELRRETEMLRMASSLSGDECESKDLKLKINELVREIDKCMALMND